MLLDTEGATGNLQGGGESADRPTVALLPFGDIFHDFLDPLGVTVDLFRDVFVGSWMFGYATALASAGVRTVILCPTSKVSSAIRTTHVPTGAGLVLLPTGRLFSSLRGAALDGRLDGRRDPRTVVRAVAAHVAPYAGTPLVGLAHEIRRAGARALLCQEYEAPRFDTCVALGRTLRRPVFGVFQGGDEQHSLIERPLRPLSMRGSAGLISGSASELQRARIAYGMPGDKLFAVPNPVDVSFWRPGDRAAARSALGIGGAAQVVAWHGQLLVHRKALDVLIEAWRYVCADRPDRELLLVLVGGGEDVEDVRRRIAGARSGGVRLVDEWVHDRARIREVLVASDLYVFPSRSEGVPVAPAEAMACGLPVVGSRANGVPDVIGDCGLVVTPGEPAELAGALGALLDEDGRRTALGKAARARAESHFSHAAVGDALRSIVLGGS